MAAQSPFEICRIASKATKNVENFLVVKSGNLW
jgi:hypothetical protein